MSLNIKDINDKSPTPEVLHVQDKLVQEGINEGLSPAQAAKLANERIRQRTGKAFDKQFRCRGD